MQTLTNGNLYDPKALGRMFESCRVYQIKISICDTYPKLRGNLTGFPFLFPPVLPLEALGLVLIFSPRYVSNDGE